MRHLIIILSLVLLVSLSGCSYCNWMTCDYGAIQDAVNASVKRLQQDHQPAYVPISPIATPTAICGEGDHTVCIR